jgi:hypothetical protein
MCTRTPTRTPLVYDDVLVHVVQAQELELVFHLLLPLLRLTRNQSPCRHPEAQRYDVEDDMETHTHMSHVVSLIFVDTWMEKHRLVWNMIIKRVSCCRFRRSSAWFGHCKSWGSTQERDKPINLGLILGQPFVSVSPYF